MKVIIKRDDSQTLTLGKGIEHNYFLTNIEGIGDIQTQLNTQSNAFADGSQFINQKYPEREIVIEFAYSALDPDRTAKRTLLSFLNSKHDFNISIISGGVTRWIDGRLYAHKVTNPSGSEALTCSITFVCPNPFFKSADSFGKDIAAITPQFHFAWHNEIGDTQPIGVYNFERQVTVNNTGDFDTYPVFRIYATGTVTNPKVLVNGNYIRLITTLSAGDVVEVNLVDKKVTLNGNNIMGVIDRTSSFSDMNLAPGDNIVKYEADNGDINMTVNLFYYNQFVGA